VSEKSIAVIPFDNRSDDKANAYFTDGVHEDILTSLANVRELKVISRTSVMEYRGTTKKIPQIARELGVAYILEGSVQRSGNTVRITGQLIRAATDEHVWAKNYDRELTATNLFAIQSELAQAIAAELQAAISPQEKTQLARAPTANLEAYELYSKGRELVYAYGPDIAGMFKEATPLWERAVVLDPNFAEAWANIGVAYTLAYNRRIARTPEAKARALDTIQTALRLAPDNPSVILALARYYTQVEGDYERALVECERAAKISRNNADLYDNLNRIYLRQGRPVDALDAARKAYDLAPRSEVVARSLSYDLRRARRYTEAEEVLRQALVLQPDSWLSAGELASLPLYARGSTREWDAWLAGVPAPTRTIGAFQRLHVSVTADRGDVAEYTKLVALYQRVANESNRYVFALKLTGQTEHARALATGIRDEQLAIVARDPSDVQAWDRLAFAYASLGEKSAALDAADKSVTHAGAQTRGSAPEAVALRHAQLLAWIDRKDEALQELAQVWLQPGSRWYLDPLTSFMWSPLHGDPRFESIKNDPRNGQPLF
jgi:TolB-like protein/Tfp pilus assembly protein PilF